MDKDQVIKERRNLIVRLRGLNDQLETLYRELTMLQESCGKDGHCNFHIVGPLGTIAEVCQHCGLTVDELETEIAN